MTSRIADRLFVPAALALLAPAIVTMSGCASTEGVEQEQVYTATNGFAVGDSVTVEFAESLIIATSNG